MLLEKNLCNHVTRQFIDFSTGDVHIHGATTIALYYCNISVK